MTKCCDIFFFRKKKRLSSTSFCWKVICICICCILHIRILGCLAPAQFLEAYPPLILPRPSTLSVSENNQSLRSKSLFWGICAAPQPIVLRGLWNNRARQCSLFQGKMGYEMQGLPILVGQHPPWSWTQFWLTDNGIGLRRASEGHG